MVFEAMALKKESPWMRSLINRPSGYVPNSQSSCNVGILLLCCFDCRSLPLVVNISASFCVCVVGVFVSECLWPETSAMSQCHKCTRGMICLEYRRTVLTTATRAKTTSSTS